MCNSKAGAMQEIFMDCLNNPELAKMKYKEEQESPCGCEIF